MTNDAHERTEAPGAYKRTEAPSTYQRLKPTRSDYRPPEPVIGLSTLQFHFGSFLDEHPVDGYRAHLVRRSKWGTPGPTLCGIDRFAITSPGWSVGGGVTGPDIVHEACPGCAAVRGSEYPDLPISGSVGKEAFDGPYAR